MLRKKILYIIIVTLLASGCVKKTSTSEGEDNKDPKEVELNLETPVKKDSGPVSDDQPVQNAPVAEKNPASDFFISGRTGLLSIKAEKPIYAEDFSIGQLYDDYSATIEEKKIIDLCRVFFESVKQDNPEYKYVDPLWIVEVKDYIEHFLTGNISFEEIVFGKPEINGGKAEFRIRIFPEKIPAYVYLSKNEENEWLLSGLEVDLQFKSEENQEKWFPSISPSPFGY